MNIVYQPIVNLQNGNAVGYEALARFNGTPPDQAFKHAWEESEEGGLALEAQAAELALRNFRPGDDDEPYLAINASAKTIMATHGELIKAPGLEVPWERIVIEITEHDRIWAVSQGNDGEQDADYESLALPLLFLRNRGTQLAVDDLGAESASIDGLSRILHLTPQILKADKELVRDVDTSPMRQSLIRAIVGIAKDMHSIVVAEGIETEAERKSCVELGVACGQGYLFGRPEPFPESPM